MMKTKISAATIVLPTGVPARIAIKRPATAQTTEITAEQIVTERKLLKRRIAEMAGKITRAEEGAYQVHGENDDCCYDDGDCKVVDACVGSDCGCKVLVKGNCEDFVVKKDEGYDYAD